MAPHREHWQDPEPGSLFGAVSRLWEPACCELLLFGLHWVNSTHSRADAVARQRWIRSESEELELCSRDPHWFHINQKRKGPGVFQLHLVLTSFRVFFSMCFFLSSRVQYPPAGYCECSWEMNFSPLVDLFGKLFWLSEEVSDGVPQSETWAVQVVEWTRTRSLLLSASGWTAGERAAKSNPSEEFWDH